MCARCARGFSVKNAWAPARKSGGARRETWGDDPHPKHPLVKTHPAPRSPLGGCQTPLGGLPPPRTPCWGIGGPQFPCGWLTALQAGCFLHCGEDIMPGRHTPNLVPHNRPTLTARHPHILFHPARPHSSRATSRLPAQRSVSSLCWTPKQDRRYDR